MNILYGVTVLVIYILFMLIYKTEKKQNAIIWNSISIILILCYNIFICVICSFIGLLCTLQNLSICNSFFIVTLIIILLKSRKIQKYYVKISDIIFSILILILVIFIAYSQYEFPFNLKHKITDASTHYFFAEQFYKSSTLLYKTGINGSMSFYNSDFRLPGAYVNEGILFKVFDGIALKTDLFVLFDLFVLYLSGILFYYLLKTYIKENKKMQIVAAIFSIIYMLGYQLNSMLYGYVYLSLALDIIIAFLLVMSNYEKKEISNKIALPILSVLSFGIFFSYAYFIAIIYIAIIINTIIKAIRNKESMTSDNNLMEILLLIINPLILGLTYFIILPSAMGIKNEISTIGEEGVIYENYITNFLAFIPIFLTGIILAIKNKKREYNLPTILLVLSILFVVILFIGNKLKIVSDYYCFKAYYIIWLFAIYKSYIILNDILENEHKNLKIATYSYISIYVMIAITTLIVKNSIGINDIFYHNVERIRNDAYSLSNGEVKLIEKTEKGSTIYTLAPHKRLRARWMSVLCHNEYIDVDYSTKNRRTIERWLTERDEIYYFAYHSDYKKIEEKEEYLDSNSVNYETVYNDEFGFILKRK